MLLIGRERCCGWRDKRDRLGCILRSWFGSRCQPAKLRERTREHFSGRVPVVLPSHHGSYAHGKRDQETGECERTRLRNADCLLWNRSFFRSAGSTFNTSTNDLTGSSDCAGFGAAIIDDLRNSVQFDRSGRILWEHVFLNRRPFIGMRNRIVCSVGNQQQFDLQSGDRFPARRCARVWTLPNSLC
jgi:hypothetical protein